MTRAAKSRTPVKKQKVKIEVDQFSKTKASKSLSRKRVDHVIKELPPPTPEGSSIQAEQVPKIMSSSKKGFCDIEKLGKDKFKSAL
jgi:hypothetical protein